MTYLSPALLQATSLSLGQVGPGAAAASPRGQQASWRCMHVMVLRFFFFGFFFGARFPACFIRNL